LGDVFRGKCTCLGKKKEENVTFDVQFINLESMTKKGHQKMLSEENTDFGGKVTWNNVTFKIIFLDCLKIF